MQITITGTRKAAAKTRDLGKLSASVIPGARRRALRSGQARSARDIGLVLNLRARIIRGTLGTDKTSLRVIGMEREQPQTLDAFGGRFVMRGRRSAGYRVRVWRGLGARLIKQAFKIPGSDAPFIREGPRRDSPIRPVYGPRIGVVFNTIHPQVRDFMRERLVTEWRKAIRGRLARR